MGYARDRDWTQKRPDIMMYYGRVKCVGYQFISTGFLLYAVDERYQMYDYRVSEYVLCNAQEGINGIRNYSGPHYDINCWSNSKTFNNRSYQVSFLCETRCISKYRVRDGIMDCLRSDELHSVNNSCSQIQHHRFQCSSSELTCLLVGELGNWGPSCSNGRDEFDSKRGMFLTGTVFCEQRNGEGCVYLRNYIQSSSYIDTSNTATDGNSISDDHLTTVMPFRSYCDSFFDTKSGMDELPQFCSDWICSIDEYQCLSGQCISQSWVCDGEWDCNDGSDEQRLFIMNSLNCHNSKLMNLTKIKEQCYQQYRSDNTPFSDICNISSEYPCFRTDVDDPFDLALHRPCIDLTQIGDGKTDCLTGLDERNRLQCSGHGMLGFHFQFNDSLCVLYSNLCNNVYSWIPGANEAYDTVCFHHRKVMKNGTVNNCDGLHDVMCLNDVCIKNARCNGKIECLHGEDEYRCISQNQSPLKYRDFKKVQFTPLRLQNYPSSTKFLQNTHPLSLVQKKRNNLLDSTSNSKSENHITRVFGTNNFKVQSVYEIVRDSLPNGEITFEKDYLPFICNRGVAVKYYTGHTICFCPPSFYGTQCEYYSDRVTVTTHLDLNNYRYKINMIKVLTTFLFEDQIIDYYEFHVSPQTEMDDNYIKQQIYFVYPRLQEFLHMKRNNRSGTQLYSVRFEAFSLHSNETIEPIGVWQYPIDFDFLPSFRLSKILRFPIPPSSFFSSVCSDNPCGKNGMCQEVLNSNRSSYFCSCQSGYYGIHCSYYDEQCKNSCSPKAICKPKYRGILTENQQDPLCLCPASTFGNRCYLKTDHCQSNPCLNGGSCIVTYDLTDISNYTCICTDSFEGDHCQIPKGMVNIRLMWSLNSALKTTEVVATTVLYSDYEIPSLRFMVRDQQVYTGLPSDLKLIYSHKLATYAPTTAILKAYGANYHHEKPKYYLLYYYPDQKEINITVDLTSENHCPSVQTLWHSIETIDNPAYIGHSTFNSTTAVFSYHHICRAKQNTNTSLTCFYDLNYLCICETDHYRAECFGYNHSIDQCSLCLSHGCCLKGELNDKRDFRCLCQRCYHGKMCQYSTEFISFTLDSLIVKDVQNNRQMSIGIYISMVGLIFLFGLFNNMNSLLTFIRPKPQKIGVGRYLLIISVVGQCSLLLLLFKVIHIILGSNGTLFYYPTFNLYSCKIISYLLSVLTRTTYWLTSFVTIERLCLVLFPTSARLKNPHWAIALSIIVFLFVAGMHIHEVMYYTTIVDPSYTSINVTLCVTNYVQSSVSTYNRVNVLIHYFIPFLIHIISITILIILAVWNRACTSDDTQQISVNHLERQFKTQEEQYITPIIIVLSSLPLSILSFLYACTELKQSWQRYILLATCFLSYLPQMLGFILYVLPSTTYSEEFRQTVLGKRLVRQQNIAMQMPMMHMTAPPVVSS